MSVGALDLSTYCLRGQEMDFSLERAGGVGSNWKQFLRMESVSAEGGIENSFKTSQEETQLHSSWCQREWGVHHKIWIYSQVMKELFFFPN